MSFPDLTGCLSVGVTIDEAAANAGDAKREWIATAIEDGYPIGAVPNPKIFDINPKFLDTNPKVKPKVLDTNPKIFGINSKVISQTQGLRRHDIKK